MQYAWLIPVLPLAAFLIIVFATYRFRIASAVISLLSVTGSFGLSVWLLVKMIQNPQKFERAVDWLTVQSVGNFKGLSIQMGILIDPLSAVMLFVVTFVAMLVILYSIGYMHCDTGFTRYFAYISLFTFSMLGLVISNNYFQMFVFWELVGLCSYLLIGFWFMKPEAADASKKAFVTNRWADFGLMTGIILLFVFFGTFNFGELAAKIPLAANAAFVTLAGILIFMGPVGKSAQFPLHVWLPDAMEGPTPISALIHAATMVAAGVYLVARGYALFAADHTVMLVISYVGGFTALFAALIALVQRDIKRILAFSTLSQLGYMVMALGVGSLTSGMFHLTTHAFFKALLFLGAGSVIHALHEQDIFSMGGLSKKMPVTAVTFIIGALALSGIFPLAGFWSKDEILSSALHHGFTGLYVTGSIVAFLTAFYMFRLIFVTFFGAKKENHAHESPLVMTLPLVILAIFSVFAGFVNSPLFYNLTGLSFGTFLYYAEPEAPHVNMLVAGSSTLLALGGIFGAWLVYQKRLVNYESLAVRLRPVHALLYNKFYIDNLYQWLFDHLMFAGGKVLDWIDHVIIDGLFDGSARTVRATGRKLRLTQTGLVQSYALVFFIAVVLLVLFVKSSISGGR